MGVRMSPTEVEAFLAAADVGILTTLAAHGSPVSLPMWFVLVDGAIHVRTRISGKKVRRLERDDRVSFVVERGAAWSELAAVVLNGTARPLTGRDAERVEAAFADKYADRGPPEDVPTRTRQHYAVPTVCYRLEPTRELITWSNAKLVARDG